MLLDLRPSNVRFGLGGAGFCGDCALLPAAGRRGTRCR
jgi:hypothetical protein